MDLEWPTLETNRTLDEYLENVEQIDTIKDFTKLKEKLEEKEKNNNKKNDK